MSYIFSFTKSVPVTEYKVRRHWLFWYKLEKIEHPNMQASFSYTLPEHLGKFILANQSELSQLLKKLEPTAHSVQLEHSISGRPNWVPSEYVATNLMKKETI